MVDPIAAISGAIDIAKKLREVSKKINDADTMNLIADLNLALADVKIEVAELKEDNLQLQQQLRKAQEQPDFRSNLELKDGVYFFKEPVDGRPDGPYCPTCFDVDERLVIISEMGESFRDLGRFHCNHCKGSCG